MIPRTWSSVCDPPVAPYIGGTVSVERNASVSGASPICLPPGVAQFSCPFAVPDQPPKLVSTRPFHRISNEQLLA